MMKKDKKNLKILVVSDPYYPYPSGVSEYTYYLSKYLKKNGNDVTILTTNYKNQTDEDRVVRFGKVLMIPLNRSYATMAFGTDIYPSVKNFLNKNYFDIIHLNGPFFPSLSFFALHFSNSINIAAFLNAGFKFYKSGSSIFKMVYKKYLNKISGYLAISQTAKLAMEPYFPGEYEIIPAGVDTDFFTERGENFNIEGFPKILFLGRLDLRKGVLKIIDVFNRFVKIKNEAKLIIAGKGPLEKTAKDLVRRYGIEKSVIFTGYVKKEDIPKYYRTADIYCSPALGGESFGIVLLEAMSCGTPIIASRIHGYSQVIDDKKDGLLFNNEDDSELLSKLIELTEDENKRAFFRKNGLIKSKEYSWENVIIKIEKFYKKIIEQKK